MQNKQNINDKDKNRNQGIEKHIKINKINETKSRLLEMIN